jgi:hypothetical protein
MLELALPNTLDEVSIETVDSELVSEDEWIWGAVAAAIVLFGGVAAACRAICWGRSVYRCKTTWYGFLDVVCR